MKRKIKNKACGKNQGRGYSQSRNKDWKDWCFVWVMETDDCAFRKI
jgi:hypothetical protein